MESLIARCWLGLAPYKSKYKNPDGTNRAAPPKPEQGYWEGIGEFIVQGVSKVGGWIGGLF